MNESEDLELGRKAIDRGLLKKEDLEEALRQQGHAPGTRLGDVLQKMKLLKQDQVDTILQENRKPAFDIKTVISDHDSPSSDSPPGPLEDFGDFLLLEERGRGGMGVVYKARQKNLDRLVAIKILSPGKAENPTFQKRFEREAKALAALSHPNIVGIHDFGKRGENFYLVMEYVEGLSLRELLQVNKLSSEDIFNILGQLCDALEYAHQRGIIHRDIKPDNILIDREGQAKIADFGLAKLGQSSEVRDKTLTMSGVMMGTMNYMAPEQMENSSEVDSRADLFSTGVLLYEMLTGELPIGTFEPPSKKGRGNSRLDEIVNKALAKDPDKRYQRASELKEELDRASIVVIRLDKKKNRTALVTISLILLLVGGGFFVWQGLPKDDPQPSPAEISWTKSFRSSASGLEFSRFTSVKPNQLSTVRALLDSMPPDEESSLLKWFQDQFGLVPSIPWSKAEWLEKQSEARRIRAWTSALLSLLEGKGDTFAPLRKELKKIDNRFAIVAAYRGTVDLTLFITPYAEIHDLRTGEEWIIREGKRSPSDAQIIGESLGTPLVIRGIDIGTLQITMVHPELGKKEVTLPANGMKNGEAWSCSGSLTNPEGIALRPLP